jgi:cobalt-zinc-cadmium efflux system membrane fusion protein
MKILLIFIAILTLASCKTPAIEQTEHAESTGVTATAIPDAITAATRTNTQPTFNGVLVIPPQRHATVTLFMDGVVKNTSLLSGTFVRRGQLLATLENPEYIALQQTYIESYAQEEFLAAEFERQEKLFNNDAASQRVLQQSRADYLSMKSRREATAAQLRMLGFDPARVIADGITPYLELRAPIDGYVANAQLNVGRHIPAGSTVCDIIDRSTTLLKLTVFERDISKIQIGDKMEFRMNGLGTEVFEATVISLGQMVDNINRSLEVYARVDSRNAHFRPGMYVTAQITEVD